MFALTSRRVAKTGTSRAEPSCDTAEHGYQCYPTVAQYWGQYSPFFSVPSDVSAEASGHVSGDASALPSGCRFTFAQVLSRHGARDPTAGKSAAYAALMARILTSVDRRHLVDGPEGRFGFLARYHYRLGADELTRFGVRQMVHSGAHFFERYRGLIRPATATKAGPGDRLPFVRSADQHRVVMSAINWVRGFQAARQAGRGHGGTGEDEQQIVLLPEAAGFNNTLSYNGLCPAFSGRAGTAAQGAYAGAFVPPITARLNRGLPGAALADEDTISLMDLCPYETVADETAAGGGGGGGAGGQGGRRLAGFCHLFSEAEWRAYDYYQTLGKWYGYGDGSALGASQGVGFVNELIARLTQQPVADRTSTNRTLDADPATFPLNASVYADFSHDNDMANVFAALGLYNGSAAAGEAPLRPDNATRTEPGALRGYAASWTVPFAARMYVEKMVCGAEGGEEPAAAEEEEEEELVRILVNDRVVPLANCGADAQGRCRLGRFVESLAFARSGGRWDDCFA